MLIGVEVLPAKGPLALTNAQAFTVLGPALTSINPTSGFRNTTVAVTLSGSNLTGTTTVNVSGGSSSLYARRVPWILVLHW